MRKCRDFGILFFMLIYLIGCGKAVGDISGHSKALIVLGEAQNINYSELNGVEQVTYNINSQYPATQLIKDISQQLEIAGWKPLLEDYLNRGLPSSHVRGWSNFVDTSTGKSQIVYQWLAQWENNNHDILWLVLRYSFPEGEQADFHNLHVTLRHVPVTVARQMRQDK